MCLDFTPHRNIGGGPCEVIEIRGRTPEQTLVFKCLQFATNDPAAERPQANFRLLITPIHWLQRRAHDDLDAQFFPQLANKGRFCGFPGLHLATGKLPKPAKMFILRAETG